MPTYEYQCEACQHAFEVFQPMSATPIKKCPECGKNKVRRLIGAGAGLIFKGSGFYITDYRDGGYKEQAKADSAAAAGSTGDAKPATDSKGGDSKSGDSKSSDAKPAETKAADAKPATKESAPTPKAEPKASSSSSKRKPKN